MADILNNFNSFIDNISDEDFIKLMKQSEKCPWVIVLPRLRVKKKRKVWVRKRNG